MFILVVRILSSLLSLRLLCFVYVLVNTFLYTVKSDLVTLLVEQLSDVLQVLSVTDHSEVRVLSLWVNVSIVLLVAIGGPCFGLEVLSFTTILYHFLEVFMEWSLRPGIHGTSACVAEKVPGPPASCAEFSVAPVLTPSAEHEARPANEGCK